MSLLSCVEVNTNYTRSVNIERDAGSDRVLDAYLPTSRAVHTLERIVETLNTDAMPRSWALTGPYGSGKSMFALFVSHLFGDPKLASTQRAYEILGETRGDLVESVQAATEDSCGYCRILLTGTPDSLSKRFVEALADGAEDFWSKKKGSNPAIVGKLRDAADTGGLKIPEIIALLKKLQKAVAKSKGAGIFVVIDELGKFLEFEARHPDQNDIFLLQALAEHAASENAAPIQMVVLLHQAFEQYARGLGDKLRNEWAKVQGRYASIAFLEAAEQVMRVMDAAITHNLTKKQQAAVKKQAGEYASVLAEVGALPGTLDEKGATALFTGCYPLHPVALLLLPTLCQRVAQNERTLFSYLGSDEAFGFQETLSRLDATKPESAWVMPVEIYEYFILNQPGSISDHFTYRRWAEVVTAVERLGDAPELELSVLKTIGLLNIVGAQGGLKASPDVMCMATNLSKRKFNGVVNGLAERSVVQFRKFSGEYRVWQGSDFDLEAAVQDEMQQLGLTDLAKSLNDRNPIMPIVARKHTIETGTMRYFVPHFVDAQTRSGLKQNDTESRILIYLTESADDSIAPESLGGVKDVVVLYAKSEMLRDANNELLALQRIERSRQELRGDPVAQREFADRRQAALRVQEELLRGLLEEPEDSVWFYKGSRLEVHSKRGLQVALSSVLNRVYHAAPIIHNELLNREKPSASASAARNKLIIGMLLKASEPDFGIDKFPAEKAMYRSLLKASGLHKEQKDEWVFAEPNASADPLNLIPMWEAMGEFLTSAEQKPRTFADLVHALSLPPYGVRAGVVPVFFLTLYMLKHHEIALFEEKSYLPAITHDVVERMIRRPHTFAMQRFRMTGMRASMMDTYSKAIVGGKKKSKSLLDIVRPLAKFMTQLPQYSRYTRNVSKEARELRRALEASQSPSYLLFEALPKACGFDGFTADTDDDAVVQAYSEKLISVIRELGGAYTKLLTDFQNNLASALGAEPGLELGQLRERLAGRYGDLGSYTVDVEGLKAFVTRLSDTHGDDKQWLISLGTFLGRKPPEKWNDDDVRNADFRLAELSKRLHDLEQLRISYDRNRSKTKGDFEVVLLRVVRQGAAERDEVVCIEESTREQIDGKLQEMVQSISRLPHKQQLALVAELTDRCLSGEIQKVKKERRTKKKHENQIGLKF